MFTIEFYALIGHNKKLNTNERQEFFKKTYDTLNEAKNLVHHDMCLFWEEGEWEGYYITISFKRNPKVYDEDSKLVS